MNCTEGKCAKCGLKESDRVCFSENGKSPAFCCTALYPEELKAAMEVLNTDEEVMRFSKNAALEEVSCYEPSIINPAMRQPCKPRILETIDYAKRMGFHKLGLAFCLALREDAKKLNEILESHGFEVVSVACKVGGVDKSALGVDMTKKVFAGHESMCNPVAQAMILNKAGTEFNLMLGLCTGHDTLFLKYVEAPVTIIAVKDRMLGNNPLAALHADFYSYLKCPEET